MAFTTLAHHIDVELLHVAYKRTRKDGAAGVDGQTAADFEQQLEIKLHSLVDRLKSGTYVAPPVRRVHIRRATFACVRSGSRRSRTRSCSAGW